MKKWWCKDYIVVVATTVYFAENTSMSVNTMGRSTPETHLAVYSRVKKCWLYHQQKLLQLVKCIQLVGKNQLGLIHTAIYFELCNVHEQVQWKCPLLSSKMTDEFNLQKKLGGMPYYAYAKWIHKVNDRVHSPKINFYKSIPLPLWDVHDSIPLLDQPWNRRHSCCVHRNIDFSISRDAKFIFKISCSTLRTEWNLLHSQILSRVVAVKKYIL